MSQAATDPMPLDGLAERRREARPLSWLRARLFRERQVAAESQTLPAPPACGGRGQALRRAHASLQLVFASHHALAQVFPHLGLLEKELARQGSQALRRLPSALLQSALEQLQELQLSREDAELPVLRNRIIEELALRSVRAEVRAQATAVDAPPLPSAADALDTDIHWAPPTPGAPRH
jgi:hypothetical protein